MITAVYGVCPVHVSYRDHMPTRAMADGATGIIGGLSVGLGRVWIASNLRANKGILAHELCHQRQTWRRPFTDRRLYNEDPVYRFRCEVEAYRAQLACYTDFIEERINAYAYFIANAYRLDITVEQARQELMR